VSTDSLPITVLVPEGPEALIEVYDQHAALKLAAAERSEIGALPDEWGTPGFHLLPGRPDDIVRQVRFDGWQQTAAGEREIKQALRRSLLRYKLHTDQDLLDRAYAYIVQYY
jgi:hypothetical protein